VALHLLELVRDCIGQRLYAQILGKTTKRMRGLTISCGYYLHAARWLPFNFLNKSLVQKYILKILLAIQYFITRTAIGRNVPKENGRTSIPGEPMELEKCEHVWQSTPAVLQWGHLPF
jgi:hypothetical protein